MPARASFGVAMRHAGAVCAAIWLSASVAPARAQGARAAVATTQRFELHSDLLINLHHFLYQWAREERGLGTGRQHVAVPERATLATLSETERDTWLRAVAFYRDSVAPLNHFDDRMLEQKRRLFERSGDSAAIPDVIPGIAAAMGLARPVYEARWWPANLWHGIIFATAGAFVQSVAEQEGRARHVPYWVKEGIPQLRGWSDILPATDEHWLPVVRGESTPSSAFAALVDRFRAH